MNTSVIIVEFEEYLKDTSGQGTQKLITHSEGVKEFKQ